MNILLVTSAAPFRSPFGTEEKRFPIGIGFLITVLRDAGHRIFFIDNYLRPIDFLETDYLIKNRIDCIGIYANTICYRDTLRMFKKLQQMRERGIWHGTIMVGGPHATVLPETIPDFVDYVVQGEGEMAILDVVEGKTDRLVRYPRIEELDSLPRPAYDYFALFPYDLTSPYLDVRPVFVMNTSRGCPFRCTFCSVRSIWGRKYTSFSAERIFDDIKYLQRTFGVKGIYFREDNFTITRKRVEALCELLLRDLDRISWMCETRVDSLDRDLIALMYRAGCRAFFIGAESGCQRVLDLTKKGITVEQTERVVGWCKEVGINTLVSFLVGVPGETPRERVETVAFKQKLNPTTASVAVYTGVPGSELYASCFAKGEFVYIDDVGIGYTKIHDQLVEEIYGGREAARVPWPRDVAPEGRRESLDFAHDELKAPDFRAKLVLYLRFSGQMQLAQGHRRKAIKLFLSALRLDPLNLEGWKNLVLACPGNLVTINIYRFVSHFRRGVAQAIERYRTTPHIVKNWYVWAVRRALLPYVKIHCWVISSTGSKFFLGSDPVDDLILEDVLRKFVKLYFPDELSHLPSEFLVLDVGAHHGFYAVEALRRYPEASLIAVEPNPVAIKLLNKNLAANNALHRLEIVQAGIGCRDDFAFLAYSEGGSWGDRVVPTQNGEKAGVGVRTSTLATILRGRKPSLVKCNAEGAEFKLFPQLFSMGIRPEFVILLAHPEYGPVDELLELFRTTGYRIRDAGSTKKRIRLHCFLSSFIKETCE